MILAVKGRGGGLERIPRTMEIKQLMKRLCGRKISLVIAPAETVQQCITMNCCCMI